MDLRSSMDPPTLLFITIIRTSGPKLAFPAGGAVRSCLRPPPPPPPVTPDTQPFGPGKQVVSREGRETQRREEARTLSCQHCLSLEPSSPVPAPSECTHLSRPSLTPHRPPSPQFCSILFESRYALATVCPTARHELPRARTSGSHIPSVCPPWRPVQHPRQCPLTDSNEGHHLQMNS